MDFYGKIDYMLVTCGSIENGLESIVDKYAAYDYISELVDKAQENFSIFIQVPDFNKKENFVDIRRFEVLMNEVLEICPLIKLGSADYSYLISMLKDLENILEKKLPENVRLARFFIKLLNEKKRFVEVMDVSEEEIDKVISGMLEHVDEVNDIINGSHEKVNVKRYS